MRPINNKELREIQLNILQEIHTFCKENNIQYSLAYGTLLGAVRHGGYIPWDDDIDIAMLRSDYERFAKTFHNHNYVFTDCRRDDKVNIGFGKVYDKRTLIIEGGNTKNLGVFVDVFPIDDLCDTYEESLSFCNKFRYNTFIRKVKSRQYKYTKKKIKNLILFFLKIVLYPYSAHSLIISMTEKLIHHKNNKSKFVGLVVCGNCEKEIIERSVWKGFKEIIFENKVFMAVSNYDSYLKHAYGNYMQLPPKEEQVPKHDFEEIFWL